MVRISPLSDLRHSACARSVRVRLILEPLETRCLLNSNVRANDPTLDDISPYDTQSEAAVLVALDGTIIVAFNDSNAIVKRGQSTGYAISSDGGASFTDMGSLPYTENGDAGDPFLARDDVTGLVYLSVPARSSAAVHVFRSWDSGVSFLDPVNGSPGQGGRQEKERLTVDNFPGKGQGNVYLVWRNFGSGEGIFFSRSTDYGESFGPSGGTLIASGTSRNVQGAHVTVGPDHTVYVFWFEQSSPQRIQMSKSTDFGETFEPAVTVTTLQTTSNNGNLNIGPFRTNAYPQAVVNPVTGALYVTYNDRGVAQDRADVFFRQSLDNGDTWSPALRLNDDTGTNDQWFPALAVTPDGSRVGMFWYDRRLDPLNDLIDRFGTIGWVLGEEVTFEPNQRITDESFPVVVGVDPAVLFYYMGEYDTAFADDSCFYTVWGDNRLPSLGHRDNNADVRFSSVCLEGAPGRPQPSSGLPKENALSGDLVAAVMQLLLTGKGRRAVHLPAQSIEAHQHVVSTKE